VIVPLVLSMDAALRAPEPEARTRVMRALVLPPSCKRLAKRRENQLPQAICGGPNIGPRENARSRERGSDSERVVRGSAKFSARAPRLRFHTLRGGALKID
jgi:hypothetical protein